MATDINHEHSQQDPAKFTTMTDAAKGCEYSDEYLRKEVFDAKWPGDAISFSYGTRTASRPRSDAEALDRVHRYHQDVPIERLVAILADLTVEHNAKLAAERTRVFLAAVGPRYKACTFDTYQATIPAQKAALDAVRAYVVNIRQHMETGANLLLHGPVGTGKDHMLVSAAREVIAAGIAVHWINGRDAFGEFRDAMDSGEVTEAGLVKKLVTAPVLAISDPLPPSGALTQFQADILGRVVDGRYRAMRPTWATLNVIDREEGDARLGAQILDRLRHGSVRVLCNWASFRKAMA